MSTLTCNVNGSAVEAQFEKTKQKNVSTNKYDEKNYLSFNLNPGETSRTLKVRILPVSAENPSLFVAIKTHSMKLSTQIAKSGFKSFVCLEDKTVPGYDPEVKCPLCQKAKELYNLSDEAFKRGDTTLASTYRSQANSFLLKETYIVRVIERGKESEGVKFWRFNKNAKGKGILDDLMSLYNARKKEYAEAGQDDNFNIFDLNNGHDIIITVTRTVDKNGKEGRAISVTDASICTPLSKDVDQANAWINDSKKWTDCYSVKNANYLSIIADGNIPVKGDKPGEYVSRTEEEMIKAQAEAQASKVNAAVAADNVLRDMTPQPSAEEVGDDLPF